MNTQYYDEHSIKASKPIVNSSTNWGLLGLRYEHFTAIREEITIPSAHVKRYTGRSMDQINARRDMRKAGAK